jgi:hypothetical protein
MKKDFIAQGLAFLLARWAPSITKGAAVLGFGFGIFYALTWAVLFQIVHLEAGLFDQGGVDIITMVFGLLALPYFCLGCRDVLVVRAFGAAMLKQEAFPVSRLRKVMAGFDEPMRDRVVAHFGRGMDGLISEAGRRAGVPVPDEGGLPCDFAANLIGLLIVRRCRSVYDGCLAAGALLATFVIVCAGFLVAVVASHLGRPLAFTWLMVPAGVGLVLFISRSFSGVLLIQSFGIALLNQEEMPLPRLSEIMAELHGDLRKDVVDKFDDDMRLLMAKAEKRIKEAPSPVARA